MAKDKAREGHDHPCPNCGYCPACGRQGMRTVYPRWQHPYYIRPGTWINQGLPMTTIYGSSSTPNTAVSPIPVTTRMFNKGAVRPPDSDAGMVS